MDLSQLMRITRMNTKQWQPSAEVLAALMIKHTYNEIAEMFDVSRNTIQRLRDRYSLIRLSTKDRHRFINRNDISKWTWDTDISWLPDQMKNGKYPVVTAYYGKSKYPIPAIRAICSEIIGEIIPPFIDCHHTCQRTDCLNPSHIDLTIQQAHSAIHNNQISKIPSSIVIKMKDVCGDKYGFKCITGKIPDVEHVGLSNGQWNSFLVQSFMVKEHLRKQALIYADEREALKPIWDAA